MIDSVFRTDKNCYLFLEEIKYVDNGKKMPENITNEIEISSDGWRDSNEANSNKISSDEEN